MMSFIDMLRSEHGGEAFIPPHFAARDALQIEWSEERVVLAGYLRCSGSITGHALAQQVGFNGQTLTYVVCMG